MNSNEQNIETGAMKYLSINAPDCYLAESDQVRRSDARAFVQTVMSYQYLRRGAMIRFMRAVRRGIHRFSLTSQVETDEVV